MTNQKLFEALQRVCGFTALESDMFEIIRAVEADKMPMTETIEQAAERIFNIPEEKKGDVFFGSYIAHLRKGFKFGANWQLCQPNPNRITEDHILKLTALYHDYDMPHSRMVEILNEIAAGKHKENIEI